MKKLAALGLTLALLLSAAACGNIFEKEYYAEEAYAAEAQTPTEEEADDAISDYAALRRAIIRLVSEHEESAQLQFQNYDGSIGQDISEACWEVKSSTALGAFAVDYISYDTTRIVSYYQAQIYITYKRTAEQTEALESVVTMRALGERVQRALRNGETYLVLELNAASATADAIRDAVSDAYYGDAAASPVLPAAEVNLFPDSGVDRIAELTLDYGCLPEELTARREALDAAVAALTDDLLPPEEETSQTPTLGDKLPPDTNDALRELRQADLAFTLAQRLVSAAACDGSDGSTAYDALVLGASNSEGAAMACKALCQAVGVDCLVVSGRLDGTDHFWNLLTVDDICAHVDVSRWNMGPQSVFLATDASMLQSYWWDTSLYPQCAQNYDYFGLEPTAAPSDDPESVGGA